MRRLFVPLFAVAALAGCAVDSIDRLNMTSLSPYEQLSNKERYTYAVYFNQQFRPNDSETEETTRIRWLNDILAVNKFCSNGYSVDSRKVIYNDKGGKIYYVLTCK